MGICYTINIFIYPSHLFMRISKRCIEETHKNCLRSILKMDFLPLMIVLIFPSSRSQIRKRIQVELIGILKNRQQQFKEERTRWTSARCSESKTIFIKVWNLTRDSGSGALQYRLDEAVKEGRGREWWSSLS